MLIRNKQFAALDIAQRRSFEDRVYAHLRKFFPEETEEIPEERLREIIREETATAEHFQIENERDVANYISAIFALRPDPDVDPEPTWVKEVLADPDLSASEKVKRLQEWVEEELEGQEADDSE